MSVNQDISLSLKQVISEQVNTLISLARSSQHRQEVLVHEIRKGIKRIRSLFRLFKPVIRDIDFHRINEMIAETGRSLTVQRESYVNHQTYKEIEFQIGDSLSEKSKDFIKQFLKKQRNNAYSNIGNSFNNHILNITFQLSKIRDLIDSLHVKEYPPELIELAIEKNYSKTIDYFTDCKISLHLEAIHKWRRFCKHVFSQLKFGPLPLNETNDHFTEILDNLSEILGKEHDFVVLDLLFRKKIYKELNQKDRDLLIQTIENERDKLHKVAFNAGRDIFIRELSFSHLEAVSN
jgi:CHAD domain-containing protein